LPFRRRGFVGCAFTGLSYIDDVRPDEQKIEFWDRPVEPEMVKSGTPQWERWRLHNGANIYHIQQRFGLNSDRQRKYRIAWPACVMYDAAKLRAIGGFRFWQQLPQNTAGCPCPTSPHGVTAAVVLSCGRLPPRTATTIVDRRVAADNALRGSPASTNTWDQSYLGHSDRGKLWVLGFAEQVCQTTRPSRPSQPQLLLS